MRDLTAITPNKAGSREEIELSWLIRVRWVAIFSLLAVFLAADYILDIKIHTFDLIGVTAIGVVSNLILGQLDHHSSKRARTWVGGALILDVLLLAILLFFYGGHTNPFSMMFLAYVALAATVLDARWTWIVLAVSLACFSALFFVHIPVPQMAVHAQHTSVAADEGFSLHLLGMFLAFALVGVIIAVFVTRLNRDVGESRRIEEERRRLISLATLTGGAAHELATPIATLSLIGDELSGGLANDPRWSEDISVMREQLARCARILTRMRGSGVELNGELPSAFSLSQLLGDLKGEFAESERGLISFDVAPTVACDLFTLRDALHGSLQALLRNGLQACAGNGGKVSLTAEVSDGLVTFKIQDTGVGMSQGTRERVGEPFFTSKPPGEGMGLGVYLTKLFALQVGGTFNIFSELGQGTLSVLSIPRRVEL
ncbi:MAG: sensor histidine kinase [Pseudomonadota bacterium]